MKLILLDCGVACPGEPPLTDQLDNRNEAEDAEDESSPILGSWPRAYTAVLIHLALWIVVLYVFTVRFDLPQ